MHRLPVFILIAMLGNSGLACACALVAMDEPAHAHHGESTADPATQRGDHGHCKLSCGGHAISAASSKAGAMADIQPEKPAAVAVHSGAFDIAFSMIQSGSRPYPTGAPSLPSSTPVSRRDTMLD